MGIDSGYVVGSLKTGVCTSTTRPAVPFDGQTISETDTDSLSVYKGSAWAPVSGLTLISATTIGTTVSSVTVSNAFSATYDNYKIIVSGGVGSLTNNLRLTLGSTVIGYLRFGYYGVYTSPTVTGINDGNEAFWGEAIATSANNLSGTIELNSPYLAKTTGYSSIMQQHATGGLTLSSSGFLNTTTQYTAFTLTCAGGTITGGTIRVYGYSNS
jgi:hypothetical protein